jgi:hypothetical protein
VSVNHRNRTIAAVLIATVACVGVGFTVADALGDDAPVQHRSTSGADDGAAPSSSSSTTVDHITVAPVVSAAPTVPGVTAASTALTAPAVTTSATPATAPVTAPTPPSTAATVPVTTPNATVPTTVDDHGGHGADDGPTDDRSGHDDRGEDDSSGHGGRGRDHAEDD